MADSSTTRVFVKRYKTHPGSKSKIWKYFGFLVDDSGATKVTPEEAFCELCDERIKRSSNTTNLLTHLKRHHFIEYDEVIAAIRKQEDESSVEESSTSLTKTKQQRLDDLILKKEAYKKNSLRYQTCQNALVSFICNDLQPISVVDSPAFRHLLFTLDPRFQPYSRSQFSRVVIPMKYDEVKQSIKEKLEKAEFISLTTDMWTGCHNHGYISLSAHFVGDDWKMDHYCLQTREVISSHTAQNLAGEISCSLDEWGITDKVVMVTTDNGQNIKNAIIEELQYSHLCCVGHTLQLGIGKALQLTAVSRVLGRVRKLVEHFHKSTLATNCLREKQIRLELPQHVLVMECKTRWSSTYHMIQRVQEQQAAICAVLAENRDRTIRSLLPENEEWSTIEDLLSVLKPFCDGTTIMSGSRYPTFSLLAPLLHKLLEVTLKIKENDSEVLKNVKSSIANDLQSRYNSYSTRKCLRIATFLDPRFKDLSPFIPAEEHECVYENTKTELLSIVGLDDDDEIDDQSEEVNETNEPEPPKKKKSKLSDFFADVYEDKSKRICSKLERVVAEVNQYKSEESIDIDEKPLMWWKMRKCQYPLMSNLAKRYFCIPATSVRSEEIFSVAGNVLNEKRNRLLPENVDKLVFLHENLNSQV